VSTEVWYCIGSLVVVFFLLFLLLLKKVFMGVFGCVAEITSNCFAL
jgi:hypothetical protein